ncbi:unnamed protein product, partial [Brassica rapa subsp. narinosa]
WFLVQWTFSRVSWPWWFVECKDRCFPARGGRELRRQREEQQLGFEARSLDSVLWPRGSYRSGFALEASTETDLWVGIGHASSGEVDGEVRFKNN